MTQVFTGPPTITIHPTSQLTNISRNLSLYCEGSGRGSITYKWEFSDINKEEWISNRIDYSKILAINELEQSQKYRCVVSNEVGESISNVSKVIVLSKLFVSTST